MRRAVYGRSLEPGPRVFYWERPGGRTPDRCLGRPLHQGYPVIAVPSPIADVFAGGVVGSVKL
jgi:hypothetical protein